MMIMPGISFAIPAKFALDFMSKNSLDRDEVGDFWSSLTRPGGKRLITGGEKRRLTGMKILSITPALNQFFQRSITETDIRLPLGITQGCLVIEVIRNSPSERLKYFTFLLIFYII
jgi:hypothetical protein